MANDGANTTIVVVGPTASGKTALSLLLARRLNAEIISADSRQIYRHLTIGTAKPSETDRRDVPHHFIDVLDPRQDYSAGEFGTEARAVLADIQKRGKRALVVGGSGLYVKGLVDGFFDGPGKDPEIRERLERELEQEGVTGLLKKLTLIDPASAAVMSREPKARRIMRALEVYYSTGKPLSVHFAEQKSRTMPNVIMVAPLWERALLYKHIDDRVTGMMKSGFLEEVRWLESEGYPPHLNALNTVGYRELVEYLGNKITLEEAVSLIKMNTRRFAKRQMTWFKRDERIRWIPVHSEKDLQRMAEKILGFTSFPRKTTL
jgi:tRNA dimethylallyltransferase